MTAPENRRTEISTFLHLYGYLGKEKLIDRAIRENLYKNAEGREDIYRSLMTFKDYHGIKCKAPIVKTKPVAEEKEQPRIVLIDGKIKVSSRSNKLVSAIKEELANLQAQQRLLENLLAIYDKDLK